MKSLNKQNKDKIILISGLIYFFLIPLILIFIYFYSNSLSNILSLYPQNPNLLSIIGSNYLHTSFPHFIQNLIMYLLIISFIFYFDRLYNKKMIFVNLPLFFIILPIFSSIINSLVFSALGNNTPQLGFSAIVAGVIGYLAFSTIYFIKKNYNLEFERGVFNVLLAILCLNLLLISLIYGYYLIIILLSVIIVIYIFYAHRDYSRIISAIKNSQKLDKSIILVSLSFCLGIGIAGLFPEILRQGNSLVNILAHYIGYTFGFMVPTAISLYIFKTDKN